MIQDSFIETSVVRNNGTAGVIYKIGLVIAAIFLIVFINFIPICLGYSLFLLTGSLSFGIVYGVIILIKRQRKEYEIEISNDLFDTAIIFGDSKREDLVSFSIKECEYIGPVTSDRFEQDKKNANYVLKITDLKEFPIEDKYWYCFLTYESMKLVVVFHYKDEMYPVFRRYNPRATKPMPVIKKDSKDE